MSGSTKIMFVASAPGARLTEQAEDLPSELGPQDLIIRLKAIAINPADVKMVDQGHRVTQWPIVPGLDGAGVVEAVGSNVSRFAIGDAVLAQFTPGPAINGGGSYQSAAVVKEMMVAKKPATMSWEDAASIP